VVSLLGVFVDMSFTVRRSNDLIYLFIVDVVYGNVLFLLLIVAELHCERADVSAVLLELPLFVV
jgi:hypothetical protein